MNFLPETYLWFKSFHIIGLVLFAGLFYLVRLFIYHVEAQTEKEEIKEFFNKQYSLIEKRLANIITTPKNYISCYNRKWPIIYAAIISIAVMDAC
tara:strand:- start:813 stop:1097 length:285 start_codon:yes stop_codon:yes gene_type:complete